MRIRVAIVIVLSVVIASCSSAPHSVAPRTTGAPSGLSSPASASPGGTAASYVAAVNALCQELLPKILLVTNNGNPAGFTIAQFKAHVAAHAALERDFDQHFQALPVPRQARAANAAMRAYIAYANQLDARRLAAANRGQNAFLTEIHAEDAEYPTSPVKKARDEAGFDTACDAR
jgi:hypothetical protein